MSARLGAHDDGPEVDPTVYDHAESDSEPCLLTESEDESEHPAFGEPSEFDSDWAQVLMPTLPRTPQRAISMATPPTPGSLLLF